LIVEQAKRVVGFKRYVREMWERRSLVQVLSGRKLKSEYEMNIVGFAWWLVEPLSLTAVYWVLVAILQKGTPASWVLFILASMLPFKWMQSSLTGAMGTVRQNASLVQDVYFPRALLPLTEVTIGLAHFGVGMLVVPLFMLLFGVPFQASLIYLPLIALVQFVFLLGLAYPFAVWGLNYRNLPNLVGNIIRLWFYLTPTLWDMSRLHNPTARLIMHLNPLTGLFEAYRGALGVVPIGWRLASNPSQVCTAKAPGCVFLYHTAAPGIWFVWTALVGVLMLVFGAWYFARREAQFGKML
jgi:ABC-type polysaccharide/polyol phosphate export permease